MIHLRQPLVALLALLPATAVILSLSVRAEISAEPTEASVQTMVLAQIVDGPDPIGPGVWRPYRVWAAQRILNPGGASRGDGGPDIVTLPSGSPLVVWALNNGPEHDIVLSEWGGGMWGPVESVAPSPTNDLDPRVFVEPDGAVHLVWWEEEAAGRVLLSSRPAGSISWSVPVQVSPVGVAARRPSVTVDGGALKVAYETDVPSPGTGQQIVVATRRPDATFAIDLTVGTTRTEPLVPILHAERGTLWLDWMEDAQSFGCARWTGTAWETSTVVPWTDATWLGTEDMRRVVRRQVLSAQ